jgi:hypothetical protein
MAAHWIFINSAAYRRFVDASRGRPLLFWGATAGLFGAAALAAQAVMGLTNPNMEAEGARDRSEELARLPMHAQARRAAARGRAAPRRACRSGCRGAGAGAPRGGPRGSSAAAQACLCHPHGRAVARLRTCTGKHTHTHTHTRTHARTHTHTHTHMCTCTRACAHTRHPHPAPRPAPTRRAPAAPQAVARQNREHLRAMLQDVAAGRDSARYRSTLE